MSDKEEAMEDAVNEEEMIEDDGDDQYEDVDDEDEEEDDDDDEGNEDQGGEEEQEEEVQGPQETYLPGKPLEEGEELICDENAYVMLHQANTGERIVLNTCIVLEWLTNNLINQVLPV